MYSREYCSKSSWCDNEGPFSELFLTPASTGQHTFEESFLVPSHLSVADMILRFDKGMSCAVVVKYSAASSPLPQTIRPCRTQPARRILQQQFHKIEDTMRLRVLSQVASNISGRAAALLVRSGGREEGTMSFRLKSGKDDAKRRCGAESWSGQPPISQHQCMILPSFPLPLHQSRGPTSSCSLYRRI